MVRTLAEKSKKENSTQKSENFAVTFCLSYMWWRAKNSAETRAQILSNEPTQPLTSNVRKNAAESEQI